MSNANPFPGMNPFMEQRWQSVHSRLITYIHDTLSGELPDDLVPLAEEQVDVIAFPQGDLRKPRPDVAIVENVESWKHGLPPVWSPASQGAELVVAEPELLVVEEAPQRWVEIRTVAGELVTVIKVLSPANKTSHREAYRTKRRNFIAAGVNVVEIDLVRSGQRTVDIPDEEYEARYAALGEHSIVCASRGFIPDRREVYPCPLRRRLPVIRIPLRASDPDVPLDIQALVDRCYTTGRYWTLDYIRPLAPPLGPDDAAWALERLAAAGLHRTAS